MTRWVLLAISLLLAAAASLTALKAPNTKTWMLAILVSEFGHFLFVLPLVVAGGALAAPALRASPAFFWPTLAGGLVAAALMLKPVWQARPIARDLPGRLTAAFGPAAPAQPAFSWRALFRFSTEPLTPEPHIFAHAGTADALTLDFYRARSRDRAPCVVVVHGGGWDSGERTQLAALNFHLARRGVAVAAVSYRLAPKHRWPAARDDVRAALAYLKNQAGALGLDPTRFVLLGRSAGGQIAEAVAYDRPDPALRGLIALYAPADLHFAWKYTDERDVLDSFKLIGQYLGGSPETVPAHFDEASPYLHARSGSVPTLLMHGKIDSLVWRRQSERLAEKLQTEKVPHVFLEPPWATHAFDFNLHGPGGQLSTFAIDWFIDAVTR